MFGSIPMTAALYSGRTHCPCPDRPSQSPPLGAPITIGIKPRPAGATLEPRPAPRKSRARAAGPRPSRAPRRGSALPLRNAGRPACGGARARANRRCLRGRKRQGTMTRYGAVAQRSEQRTHNSLAVGSNPTGPTALPARAARRTYPGGRLVLYGGFRNACVGDSAAPRFGPPESHAQRKRRQHDQQANLDVDFSPIEIVDRLRV